jgi:NAD(P)-dependent dehydrogenase (short-subunit alcohol dehydrogenase family)
MVEAAVETYGQLDRAFNNAGMLGNFALTADLTEDDFDRMVAVNLKGMWLCMKAELRQMLGQDPTGGAIVNTSSLNGFGGTPQAAFYAATKADVLGLTKSAALEYTQQGIRVNALVAGAFQTPMLDGAMDAYAGGDPQAREAIEA